jgi:hypothetical protein
MFVVSVNRLGVVYAHETATLDLIVLALVLLLCVSTYAVSLPEGRRNSLILHYIDKAGELESES